MTSAQNQQGSTFSNEQQPNIAPWRVGVGANDYSSHGLVCLFLIPITGASPALPLRRASAQCWLPPSPSLPHSPILEGNLGETKVPEAQLKNKAQSCSILPSEGCVHLPPPVLPFPSAAAHDPRPWIQSENGNIPPHCELSPFPTLPTQRGNNSKKGAI